MSLDDVRREIDRLDDQIVALLARRQQQVARAAAYKTTDAEVAAPQRRAQVMDRLRTRALNEGADPDVVHRVYTNLIEAFIDLEHHHHGSTAEAKAANPRQRVSSGSPYEASIGFSRAVRVGDRVVVSGTAPVWPDGSCPADATTQAQRCFEIITEALAAAGAGPSDVVRTRVFLTDPAVAEQVSAVHGQMFSETRPAATMVIVAGLLDPRWKVEIETEADTSNH
jgi:enamine deaminase RidA (YjgF/YER057c/UK114 family)